MTAAQVRRAVLLSLLVPVARIASAQSAGADVDVVSSYVWRGVPYSEEIAVQPSIWGSVDQLTMSFWSNLVAGDRIDRGRFNHLFVMATYSEDVGRFTIEPGIQAYYTKAVGTIDAVTTAEGIVRLSTPAGPFQLFTDHTVDLRTYRGAYIGDAGIAHERRISTRYEVATEFLVSWATARYNRAFAGVAKTALNYGSLNARVAIRINERWSLRPHVEWQPIFDRDLRAALDTTRFVTTGVVLSATLP